MSQKGRKSRPKAARFQEFPMLDRRLVAGGAAIAILVMVMALAVVLFSPRWAAGALDQMAQQQLGRSFSARGGAHLDFSPLAIRFDDATLSSGEVTDDSALTARTLTIPVTLGQLLRRRADLSDISLADAEVALLINERGEANWDFPGHTANTPMRVRLDQASFRYFDARNSQSMTLGNVDGVLDLRADGGAAFAGTAVINSRLVKIDADVKSLARINEDGSPLELALATDGGSASFSGQLSTAKVLSLAGPVSLSSAAPAAALQFIGLPLPPETAIGGSLAIDGALDSAGRAYAIRNATVSLGDFRAAGDLVADLRKETPKLQVNLAADTVWLYAFVPAAGAKDGDWGRRPLPFALLRSLDAQVSLNARSVVYGGFTAGATRLNLAVTDGRLEANALAALADDGSLSIGITADAKVLPPSVSVSLDAEDAQAQPLLGTLLGASQITGVGSYSAEVSAAGQTQEELAGTMKGKANLSLIDGRISGTDLAGLFVAARQKILDGWSAAPGGTPFSSLKGEAEIADGIATIRGASLVTPAITVSIDGILDVLRQGIMMSGNAMANGQPLLPVPVVAHGPWGSPKIYPDVPNILSNPEGGFARLQDPGTAGGN